MTLTWWQQVLAVIASAAAVATIFYKAGKAVRFVMAQIAAMIETNKALTPLVKSLSSEFRENGGSTTKDAVLRIEKSQLDGFQRIDDRLLFIDRRAHIQGDNGNGNAGQFETDDQGRCIHVSVTWLMLSDMTYYDALQGGGTGWINSVFTEDRDAFKKAWTEALRDGRAFDMRYRTRKMLLVQGNATPIVNTATGKTIGYIGSIRLVRDGDNGPN